MSEAAIRPWTVEEFFAWQERQDERYELVGGFPLKMMTGASNIHDLITVNILSELRSRLRGSGCRPFSADGSVETYPGQVRRPDAGVDCGSWERDGFRAAEPIVVIEVLSPSTRDFDTFGKLEEYKSVASIRHILFVEPNEAMAVHWSRDASGVWDREMVEGLEGNVELSALGIALPLRDIYEGLAIPERAPVRQLSQS